MSYIACFVILYGPANTPIRQVIVQCHAICIAKQCIIMQCNVLLWRAGVHVDEQLDSSQTKSCHLKGMLENDFC